MSHEETKQLQFAFCPINELYYCTLKVTVYQFQLKHLLNICIFKYCSCIILNRVNRE